MDRRPLTRATAGLLLWLAACAPPPTPRSNARALRIDRVLARGALSYAVAFAGARTLLSAELETDFRLVVRPLGGGATARLRLGPPDYDVAAIAAAPDGRSAFVASADGTIRTVDLVGAGAGPRVSATWHLGDAATAVAVSPDGRTLAAGGASGILCMRRLSDGALLQCVAAHGAPVSGLDFDPAGRRLASSSWDGRVIVWSLPALAVLAELDTGGSANQVAFSPDGARLAIATSSAPPRYTPAAAAGRGVIDARARVLLWRPVRGGAARALDGHTAPVTAVAWAARGRLLLSGSWDRSVRLWDVSRMREVGRLSGFGHLVRGLAAAPGGGPAAVASWGPGMRPPRPCSTSQIRRRVERGIS